MLIITYTTPNVQPGTELSKEWHIGEPGPMKSTDIITSIQADGDELSLIIREFQSIPVRFRKPVVRWFGENAKFIAFNL
jgi:hypothetical protein